MTPAVFVKIRDNIRPASCFKGQDTMVEEEEEEEGERIGFG